MRWDSVVEKVWKDMPGGNQEDITSIEFLGGTGRSKRKDRNKGKAGAKKEGERGGTRRDTRGGKGNR